MKHTVPGETESDSDAVRRALIRQYRTGVDVGEFLVAAVVAAEAELLRMGECSLTANRPGSWEAALLDQMIASGSGQQ